MGAIRLGGIGRAVDDRFYLRIDMFLPKVPLHAKMYRQNHGNHGGGAQHQHRKENFDYHRLTGYQKGQR